MTDRSNESTDRATGTPGRVVDDTLDNCSVKATGQLDMVSVEYKFAINDRTCPKLHHIKPLVMKHFEGATLSRLPKNCNERMPLEGLWRDSESGNVLEEASALINVDVFPAEKPDWKDRAYCFKHKLQELLGEQEIWFTFRPGFRGVTDTSSDWTDVIGKVN